jgi:2-oxoglutarate ferredoxin oxidoreductase subunit gamma
VKNPPTRDDLQLVDVAATDMSLEEGTERAANMAAVGVLLALKPDLVSYKAVEEALDEVISARNLKHNPVNRKIMRKGFDSVSAASVV